ncbi:sigma-70 family RNA polymerase sigma factor [soil metagenome]
MNLLDGSSSYPPRGREEARPEDTPTPLPGALPERETPESRDVALVQQMAGGDESALAVLYDRWAERIHSLVYVMLREADDAEDVVEETFWQAWRTADRHAPSRGSVSTWLLMIARSRALDRLRVRGRSREDAAGEFSDPVQLESASGADSPLLQAEQAEHREFITQALGELPVEQRQVVEMSFFDGLSHSQIAARTGEPLGTVKTRIRLAMRKLREQLSFLKMERG